MNDCTHESTERLPDEGGGAVVCVGCGAVLGEEDLVNSSITGEVVKDPQRLWHLHTLARSLLAKFGLEGSDRIEQVNSLIEIAHANGLANRGLRGRLSVGAAVLLTCRKSESLPLGIGEVAKTLDVDPQKLSQIYSKLSIAAKDPLPSALSPESYLERFWSYPIVPMIVEEREGTFLPAPNRKRRKASSEGILDLQTCSLLLVECKRDIIQCARWILSLAHQAALADGRRPDCLGMAALLLAIESFLPDMAMMELNGRLVHDQICHAADLAVSTVNARLRELEGILCRHYPQNCVQKPHTWILYEYQQSQGHSSLQPSNPPAFEKGQAVRMKRLVQIERATKHIDEIIKGKHDRSLNPLDEADLLIERLLLCKTPEDEIIRCTTTKQLDDLLLSRILDYRGFNSENED